MGTKLKPCPFCGCAYEKDPEDYIWAGDHEEGCPLSNTFPSNTYNVTVFDDPYSIELWNKRVPPRPEGISQKEYDEVVADLHRTHRERAAIVKKTNYLGKK